MLNMSKKIEQYRKQCLTINPKTCNKWSPPLNYGEEQIFFKINSKKSLDEACYLISLMREANDFLKMPYDKIIENYGQFLTLQRELAENEWFESNVRYYEKKFNYLQEIIDWFYKDWLNGGINYGNIMERMVKRSERRKTVLILEITL